MMAMARFNFKNIKENTKRLVGFHQAVKNHQKMKQQEEELQRKYKEQEEENKKLKEKLEKDNQVALKIKQINPESEYKVGQTILIQDGRINATEIKIDDMKYFILPEFEIRALVGQLLDSFNITGEEKAKEEKHDEPLKWIQEIGE